MPASTATTIGIDQRIRATRQTVVAMSFLLVTAIAFTIALFGLLVYSMIASTTSLSALIGTVIFVLLTGGAYATRVFLVLEYHELLSQKYSR